MIMNKIAAYKKVSKVILSCETYEQLFMAYNMSVRYFNIYQDIRLYFKLMKTTVLHGYTCSKIKKL